MGIDFQSAKRTNGGGDARARTFSVTVAYIILLVPGVFFTLLALAAYPLLDTRLAMGLMLSGFLFPFSALIVSIVRNREDNDKKTLRGICVCSSLALVTLGFLLLANGRLDRSPPTNVRTTVLEKT